MLDQNYTFSIQDLNYQYTSTNQNKFKDLASIAASIREPELYGTYHDDSHYLETLELVLNSTEETKNRENFLKNHVLTQLKFKNSILDVGTGNGQVLSSIYSHFNKITVIDTNQDALDQLNINDPKIILNKYRKSILDFQPSDKKTKFDLILLSHILYYLEPSNWINAVNRCIEMLENDGILFIALSGDSEEKAKLINHFQGQPIDIGTLVFNCIEAYGADNVQVYSNKEIFYSDGIEPMLHIAGFFLYDGGTVCKKAPLISYLKKNCQLQNGYYTLTSQQKFILIKKNL